MLANIGIPMLSVYAPVQLLAFVPVVAVETAWLRRSMGPAWQGTWAKLCGKVAQANLFSTVIGVPLTWLALVILQVVTGGSAAHGVNWLAVTWQAPWLIPYEDQMGWMIPTAALVLSVPFYVASALTEGSCLRRLLPDVEVAALNRACWQANGLSYLLLGGFWLAMLARGFMRGG